jgi:hypothetical protein
MISLRDMIDYLKNKKADPKRTSTTIMGIGLVIILPALLSSIPGVINDDAISELGFSEKTLRIWFSLQMGVGLLWIISGYGIRKRYPWSKRLGQLSVILGFTGLVSGIMDQWVSMFTRFGRHGDIPFDLFFFVFAGIISLMFIGGGALLTYYGIKYLDRLFVEKEINSNHEIIRELRSNALGDSTDEILSMDSQVNYADSVLNIGLFPSFALFISGSLAILMIIDHAFGDSYLQFSFPLVFIALFLGPIMYNRRTSPFEKSRKIIKSYTGGGAIGFFHATTPFFRLLLYEDAIEIRVFFHSFLIPYDKMEKAPELRQKVFGGISITSDLPGVPFYIMFYGSRSSEIYSFIQSQRVKCIAPEKIESDLIVTEKKLQSLDKQLLFFGIKSFIVIIAFEFFVMFSFGMIYIKIVEFAYNRDSSNTELYRPGEYQSPSKDVPKIYRLVVVAYDSEGNITEERFISSNGDTTIISYRNGKWRGTRWNFYSSQIMGAFPMIGMLLLVVSLFLGANIIRKKTHPEIIAIGFLDKLQIWGFLLFLSAFIVLPLKNFLFK